VDILAISFVDTYIDGYIVDVVQERIIMKGGLTILYLIYPIEKLETAIRFLLSERDSSVRAQPHFWSSTRLSSLQPHSLIRPSVIVLWPHLCGHLGPTYCSYGCMLWLSYCLCRFIFIVFSYIYIVYYYISLIALGRRVRQHFCVH
jgi:hypothetical protein